MDAGKPQKQALAIAYHEKRKRMADGGAVADSSPCDDHGVSGCRDCSMDDMSDTPDKPADVTGAFAHGGMIDRIMKKRHPDDEKMTTDEGEMAHEPDGPSVEDPEPEEERDDMIGRIMKKRLASK